MKSSYPGIVTADIIEVRFPFSGKISGVNKRAGDTVKKWDWLASLDKKTLQTELDKELADYERARSDFEIGNLKNQSGDDLGKFLKQASQANLNVAVKNVELAKTKLDSADVLSPVDGIVLDDGNLRIGLYVTPAGSPIAILDTDSFKFEFDITQNDLEKFTKPQKVTVSFFKGTKDDLEAETKSIISGVKGKFRVIAHLPKSDNLLPGLEGEASLLISTVS